MGPSRKRARTKPPREEETPQMQPELDITPATTTPSAPVADAADNAASTAEDVQQPARTTKPDGASLKEVKSKASWYGTWPRKSAASTQLARETILADIPNNGSSADLSRLESKKRPQAAEPPPSMNLGKSKGTSDITLAGTPEINDQSKKESDNNSGASAGTDKRVHLPKNQDTSPRPPTESQSKLNTHRPVTASSWLGWLGKPGDQPSQALTTDIPVSETTVSGHVPAKDINNASHPGPSSVPVSAEPTKPPLAPTSTSWFGLWSTAAPSSAVTGAAKEQVPITVSETSPDTAMEDVSGTKSNTESLAGSSWAFWSTDSSKKGASQQASKESGQLAVAGETSERHPEPAKAVNIKDDVKDGKTSRKPKRGRPQSIEVDETSRMRAELDPPSTKATPSQSPAPTKLVPPNILLPSVKGTYRLVENPSILQQIARLLLHGNQQPVKHVFLVKEPPKVKKALAIGIHGLFPAPLLRTVIGQPTGTSIRFANHAASAIRRWTDQHGSLDCEIEKVALEGEGRIAERVDNLWKLLLNWIDHVRKADFIMLACHSQGVPVAIMLVAKLIEFGVVSSARIGVCAMAGVNHGPFPDFRSRFLAGGSAGELFDFADPESVVSKRYEDSLRIVVQYGVRITYCASIDDQLISMESAIFSTASHPYIYRAVFVDGRIHAPDFIAHLVGFALKLRNLGVSDHGLIRELSAPLAGSLYTGEGHSRLYDDEKVYDLAIEFAIETTSVGEVPLQLQRYEIPTNANPYVLPWIMRGLLEEDFVKTELDAETAELLKQFDDWKPATKVLKDVKYRLEAVRSKL